MKAPMDTQAAYEAPQGRYGRRWRSSAQYQLEAIKRRVERSIGAAMVASGVTSGYAPSEVYALVAAAVAIDNAVVALDAADRK